MGVAFPDSLTLTYEGTAPALRREPHQGAMFYKGPARAGHPDSRQAAAGRSPYNNIGDTNGALDLLREFDSWRWWRSSTPTPAAWRWAVRSWTPTPRCYNADPVSIFSGIVVTNAEVDGGHRQEMTKSSWRSSSPQLHRGR